MASACLVKVLAVNNYPNLERFDRLRSCVEHNGAEVKAVDWREASHRLFDSYDGVILSGSPDMMSNEATQTKFAAEVEAVRGSSVPILGVCFGHQAIAHAFGTGVVEDRENVLKFVRTTVLESDPLFKGLPREIMLLESRREIVRELPVGFRLLATSETSKLAAIKHPTRLVYGVQSHPERYTAENPGGDLLVRNFLALLA